MCTWCIKIALSVIPLFGTPKDIRAMSNTMHVIELLTLSFLIKFCNNMINPTHAELKTFSISIQVRYLLK